MSTPENSTETSDLDATARERQDALTHSVGQRLDSPAAKTPWWKRLLGRS